MGDGGCLDILGAFPSSLPASPPLPMFALAKASVSTGGHGIHRAVADRRQCRGGSAQPLLLSAV